MLKLFFIFLSCVSLLSACAAPDPSWGYRPASDDKFIQQVEAKMPGFVLTPRMLGHSFNRSEGYAVNPALHGNRKNGPEFVFSAFLKKQEKTGLRALKLYTWVGNKERSHWYWRIDFPGCAPGTCVDTFEGQPVVPVTEKEYHRYSRSSAEKKRLVFKDIHQARIDGIDYIAILAADRNEYNELVGYTISFQRAPLNEREVAWRDQYRRGTKLPILFTEVEFVGGLNIILQNDKPKRLDSFGNYILDRFE